MYKCTKTSWWGTVYDAWDWEKKETNKTIIFTRIREPFYSWWYDKDIIKISKEKPWSHSFHDWEDWTYTVYPNRSWTPFYFESYANT